MGLISRKNEARFLDANILNPKDSLSGSGDKAQFLSALVSGRKFQDLDRWLRMDLAAIDGSTILLRDGTVHAVGAILKVKAGSRGGGRQSAAETVGRYGLGIKISSDGEINGFWAASQRQRKSKIRFTFA